MSDPDEWLEQFAVAPYTGAWIEIAAAGQAPPRHCVAPYTGAWIEIRITGAM
ncbi:hypothetical protein [Caproicibacterium sp. XB2]|uniref:hypothetical protein n=1 Tax=Caproicibacterium sp. XB2 TaxID=3388458 RepID=UPI00384CD5A5